MNGAIDDILSESPFEISGGENTKQGGTCTDAADWLAEPDEPDNPLVAGFIECGEVFAMVGQAKAGKSLMALQLAVCIATGTPFVGMACARRRVYVANLEVSAKQYKKRLRRICGGLGLKSDDLRGRLFIDNMKSVTATWADTVESCRRHRCEVAIVDPFYQIARIVETDEAQCLDAIESMKAFSRMGVSLGVVFHSPKGFSGDRQLIDMISGSSILARFPESVIGLLNHATDKTARVVDAVLRNYAPPEPFAVSVANGMLEVAPDVEADVATTRNAWKRTQKDDSQASLEPYVMAALEEYENKAAGNKEYRGVPVGVLADKARKKYVKATHKALGEKRMPAEIRTLQADERIVVTSRVGRDGVKYAGTPRMMTWWTSREDGLGSAKEAK
ncbi:MAG: AAA family ATPase [Kiritimatiellae bacterium]|nr:AAA family ATPase [Kiritimatiellia bacterium]MBR0197902.1 AAA family ATPase [Kiritimatiellia bacterium]